MFIESFIRYLQFEKRFSPNTVTAYRNDLEQFYIFIQTCQTELHEADYQKVRSWMVEMMDRGIDPKTINRKISSLRSFYKFLQREALIEFNPMIQVKSPKVSKRLPVVITEQKMNRLLDDVHIFSEGFSGARDRLIIELLYGTGIRLSELVGLKDSDFNEYEQYIKVLGKRNKERIIPLNGSLCALVKEYIKLKINQEFDTKSSALLVTNEGKGVYPKFIYRVVNLILSQVSTHEKRSPHILRHSFATSLLSHGADLNAIKELLGHSSLAATQVYTHNSVEKLKLIYKQAHPKA